MISTISRWLLVVAILAPLLGVVVSCDKEPVPATGARTQRVAPAHPPLPVNEAQPAPPQIVNGEVRQKDRPFYGSTHFMGEVTSVYWYPSGNDAVSTPDLPSTHIKFEYREDDIWLCGDQRSKFDVGQKYNMTVTFEPNADCVTNWKVR